MIATLRGSAGHDIVEHALTALRNLEHRGATGAEEDTGDGTGIMVQLPDAFLREVSGLELPPLGAYAAGIAFLPREAGEREEALRSLEEISADEGLRLLGLRDVPTTDGLVGPSAEEVRPDFAQVFLADAAGERTGIELERAAFAVRRRMEHTTEAYFPSLSTRVMVYKGMLTPAQLDEFYPDLRDPRFASELAIVHSRFSTNTFPAWPLAHPFRSLAHNGEINTVIGNRNRLRAAEGSMRTDVFGEDFERLLPVATPGGSDSAALDEALELLHLAGRSLPHALMMLIPEPWENDESMDPKLRAFYEFHSALQEPWDGPASVVFTDGTQVGARLDRNGLRPLRYWITQDDLVILGSETGLVDVPRSSVVRTGRVAPGEIFLLDLAAGEIVPSAELKHAIATEHPYDQWVREQKVPLTDLPAREHIVHSRSSVVRRQQTFGYTEEELRILTGPDGREGRRTARGHGHRHPGRGALGAPTAAVRLLHTDVRAGHESPSGLPAGGDGHVAGRGDRSVPEPAGGDCAAHPPARPGLPDPGQRRAREDHVGGGEPRHRGLPHRPAARAVPRRRRHRRPRTAPAGDLRGGRRRDRRRRRLTWCSRTATPTRCWPRSRPCC